jgi:hypothetical protein
MPESSALWHKLDARSDACLGSTCPDYRRCFITEMRRRALESDIIIVNHHLFFADLAVKREAAGAPDAGILPEAAAVIFDEAHELEEVASNTSASRVSNIRFEELARDIDVLLRGKKGATNLLLSPAASRARAHVLRRAAHAGDGRHPFSNREEFLESSGDLYLAVRATLKLLEAEMERLTAKSTKRPASRNASPPPLRARIPARIEPRQHGLLARAPRWTRAQQRRPKSAPAVSGNVRTRFAVPQNDPRKIFAPAGPRFSRPRPSTSPSFFASWSSTKSPPSCSPRPRSPCRAASSICAAVSASLKRASSSSLRTSATASRPCSISRPDARPARSRISRGRRPLHRAHSHASPAAAPSASSPATRRCAPSTSACCPCSISPSFSTARSAQSPARGVPRHAQRRPLRHRQLLAGRRRAGRGAQLRHHRPLPFAVPSDPVVQARMKRH